MTEEFVPNIFAAHHLGYTQPGGVTPKDMDLDGSFSYSDVYDKLVGARDLDHAPRLGDAPLRCQVGCSVPFLIETKDNGLPSKILKLPVRAHTDETVKSLIWGMWVACGTNPFKHAPLMFREMRGDDMVLFKPNSCEYVLTKQQWTTSAFQCVDGFSSMQVKYDEDDDESFKRIQVGGPTTVGLKRKNKQGGLVIPATLAMVGIDQYDVAAVANMSATLNIDNPKQAGVDAVYTMVLVALSTVMRLPNELDDDWRVFASVGPVLFSNEPQHLHLTYADTVKVALNESLVALALGEHASGDFPVKYDGLAVHRAMHRLLPETRVQGHVDENGIQQDAPVSPAHDPDAIDVVLLGEKQKIPNTGAVVVNFVLHEFHYVYKQARKSFAERAEAAYLWRGCVLVNNKNIHFSSSSKDQANIMDALESLHVLNPDVIQQALRKYLINKRRTVVRVMKNIWGQQDDVRTGFRNMFAKFATQGICIFYTDANDVPDWAKEHKYREGYTEIPRGTKRGSTAAEPLVQYVKDLEGALAVASCDELCDALKDKLAADAKEQTTAFTPDIIARRLAHTLMQLEDETALQRMTGQEGEEVPELHPAPVLRIIAGHVRKKRKVQDMVDLLQVATNETPASDLGDQAGM